LFGDSDLSNKIRPSHCLLRAGLSTVR
jgi:hypothetical protein